MHGKNTYSSLEQDRSNYIVRAYKSAAITLPRLFNSSNTNGPDKYSSNRDIDTPRNSIATLGVNHLSAKLLSILFPVSQPFFKLSIPLEIKNQFREMENVIPEIESNLRTIESDIHGIVNSRNYRSILSEAFKHLIISGNVLLRYNKVTEGLDLFPLDSFVIKRSRDGSIDQIIIKQEIRPNKIYDEKTSIEIGDTSNPKYIYTCVHRDDDKFILVQQDEAGEEIPNTRAEYTEDNLPFIHVRYNASPNESYGRGLVEEILGELKTLEELEQSVVEICLASSRLIGLINPAGTTMPSDINRAKNGEFVLGTAGDITFLQVAKGADASIAMTKIREIEARLGKMFLLNSTVLDDPKNVTATAIRFAAQELETALGGIYTQFSFSLQLPLVKIITDDLMGKGLIPKLPPDTEIQITTGFQSLGRAEQVTNLAQTFGLLTQLLGPEVMQKYVVPNNVLKFIMSNSGILESGGLLKSDAQIAEEEARSQQQALMSQMAQVGGNKLSENMGNNFGAMISNQLGGMMPQENK